MVILVCRTATPLLAYFKKSRAVIAFILKRCGVLKIWLLFFSYIYQACFVSFPYHIFFLPLPRSESRTTAFCSVITMYHLLVIARVLALSFVVLWRIPGQCFYDQRLYLISVLIIDEKTLNLRQSSRRKHLFAKPEQKCSVIRTF